MQLEIVGAFPWHLLQALGKQGPEAGLPWLPTRQKTFFPLLGILQVPEGMLLQMFLLYSTGQYLGCRGSSHHGRGADGIGQRFRGNFAEVQMENCRGADGVL